jgi:hypothetical protein
MMLATAVVLVACSSATDDEPRELQATEEPAASTEDPDPSPSPEEPSEPEDPYAVPDEIDEAYAERVINAILEVRTEILRGALQQQQGENLDTDLLALHFATTVGTERAEALDVIQGYIDDPETRGGLFTAEGLGENLFEVEHLHQAEPDWCILVLGYWDRAGVSSTAPSREDSLTAFSLSRVDDSVERSQGNPTPWLWRDNQGVPGDLEPEQFDDLPWAEELDHTCTDLD